MPPIDSCTTISSNPQRSMSKAPWNPRNWQKIYNPLHSGKTLLKSWLLSASFLGAIGYLYIYIYPYCACNHGQRAKAQRWSFSDLLDMHIGSIHSPGSSHGLPQRVGGCTWRCTPNSCGSPISQLVGVKITMVSIAIKVVSAANPGSGVTKVG